MDERVSINIDAETRRRLRTWKSRREMNYDEAITELLDRDAGITQTSDADIDRGPEDSG